MYERQYTRIDADKLQHWLRNPMEEYVFCKERTQKLARELGLAIPPHS